MKKILTLSLGLVMALGFTGCKNKKTTTYEKITEPKAPGEYSYEGKGYLVSRVTMSSRYGKYGVVAQYDEIYDENDNLVFQYFYDYNFETKEATRLVDMFEMTYEDGKRTCAIQYFNNSDRLRRLSKTEYIYDGDKIKTMIDYGANYNTGAYYKESTTEYTYDEVGNLVTETRELEQDGPVKGLGSYLKEYTYDSNNNLIKSILKSKSYKNEEWKNRECYEYTYDSNGNTLTEIFKAYTNEDTWSNRTKKEYSYDSNNNEVLMIKYDYVSDWKETNKIERTYDTNNNITDYKAYRMNESTWDLNDHRIYTYEDNKLKEVQLTGYRYVYTYKEYN